MKDSNNTMDNKKALSRECFFLRWIFSAARKKGAKRHEHLLTQLYSETQLWQSKRANLKTKPIRETHPYTESDTLRKLNTHNPVDTQRCDYPVQAKRHALSFDAKCVPKNQTTTKIFMHPNDVRHNFFGG